MNKVVLLQHASDTGKAEFRLLRLIQFAGFRKDDFEVVTVYDQCPPFQNRVLVPMGNLATQACIGRQGILDARGYVYPAGQSHCIPTVHPNFIQRGQSRWSAAFINDLQKAVRLNRDGLPPAFLRYTLDPTPMVAYQWAQEYREALRGDDRIRLAFDIETPGKGEDEDDVDTDGDAPDATWHIFRIGFSYRPYEALSVPWEPAFFPAIRMLLGSDGAKIVWNAGFDVPRIRRAGVAIDGTIHDGMVAWHILHSDLPKKLGFVATFTCPWQPAWKHLSGSKPAFYNATDADVELRSVDAIFAELERTSLWDVYKRDVLDLEPVLVSMQRAGMPVDPEVRYDRATRLAERLRNCRDQLEAEFPLETRRIDHVYVNTPKSTDGLLTRPGNRVVPVCPACGLERPRKEHFKTFKRKGNPCAGYAPEPRTIDVTEYYRLAEFTPSRDQLIRYHQWLKRPMPMVYDKKTRTKKISFAEKEIKKLMLAFPSDPCYDLILTHRGLDKIAGTYIGRPA